MMNRVRAIIALCALLALAPATGLAQPAAPSRGSANLPSDAELRLKQAVRSSFRVLPIRNGLILVPLTRHTGVDNVELRDGMIAINGTVVTGAEIRQRLGRDGDTIVELSYLDESTQRRLLLDTAEAAPSPASPAEPQAEAPPAASTEPPAEPAQPSSSWDEEHRSFRRNSEARVRIGGSITVDEDEEVNGAVVAVGGSVEVNGRVRDDVVAVGGGVHLGPKAEVYGSVTSVGGTISRDPSATVRGEVNEVAFTWPNIRIRPHPWVHFDPWWSSGPWRSVQLLGTLVRMGLFALLAAFILLLAPRAVQRVESRVLFEPWKAGLVGFFTQLIFVPLLVVTVVFLVITIIGIPLLVLVPFAILALFAALLLGFTGTATAVAHGARSRFGWTTPGPLALLVVGLLSIWGLTMVGRIVSLPGGPFTFVGGIFLLVGFLVEYAAWTVGLGAAILTRFGRSGGVVPPPVPPPHQPDVVPEPPPVEPPPLE